MRTLALCLAIASGSAAAGDRVMRAGANELRLTDKPCAHGIILDQIKPQWHHAFKSARATVNGQIFSACWAEQDGLALVIFEDADRAAYPLSLFKDSPNI